MCILIVCPPDQSPRIDDLLDAIDQNPDGHGWAIRVNGTIERMVSLDGTRALSTFLAARERWPHTWALWHSRFATQGLLDTNNCQPIPVPSTGWVMGHNGILPLSDGPWDRSRSDSRILAEDHLSGASWQALRSNYTELDRWLSPSKVAVMSPRKEKGGRPVIIFGENRGTWAKDGCWWSARPYWPVTPLKTADKAKTWDTSWDQDDDDEYDDELTVINGRTAEAWDDDEWDAYQLTLKALEDR